MHLPWNLAAFDKFCHNLNYQRHVRYKIRLTLVQCECAWRVTLKANFYVQLQTTLYLWFVRMLDLRIMKAVSHVLTAVDNRSWSCCSSSCVADCASNCPVSCQWAAWAVWVWVPCASEHQNQWCALTRGHLMNNFLDNIDSASSVQTLHQPPWFIKYINLGGLFSKTRILKC